MKIFLWRKIFFAIFISIFFVNSASAETLDAETKNILDKNFSELIGEEGEKVPGFGVVAFKNGEKIYSGFFGKRNLEKNLPMTEDTRFRVASVSKMFTAFGIMKLVEQGKINLDEDVSNYLGFKLRNPNFPEEKITCRMLASHTSTLRDGFIYGIAPHFSLQEFFKVGGVAYDGGNHFSRKDKNYFTYCNLNYGVLATVIEKVSGERFDQFQKKNIFEPLEIKADYIVGNLGEEEFKNLGAIYRKNSRGLWSSTDNYSAQPPRDIVFRRFSLNNYKIGSNATCFSPQSGLMISFNELSNVLEMLVNGGNFRGKQILRQDLLEEMLKSQWIYNPETKNGDTFGVMFNYGLGSYKIDGSGKARLCKDFEVDLIGHSGEAYGLISGIYFVPDTKNGVLFMTNGRAISLEDKRSFGKFSAGFIWEEEIVNPICEIFFRK